MEKKREKEAQELSSDNMPVERKAHVCQSVPAEVHLREGSRRSFKRSSKKAKNRFTTLEEEEKHFHPDRGAWRAEAEEIREEEVNLLGRLKPNWGATVKRRNVSEKDLWIERSTLQRCFSESDEENGLRHLLNVTDKEDKRIRRGGEENNKGKGTGEAHHHVSGSCSSEDDTDEYYCNNHMEEIRINGGILNPKQINYRNKESLMEPESESKNKKRRVLEVESAEEEKNKCNFGRGFSSSQPLGRHKEIMQQQHDNNMVKTEIPNTSNDNDENQSIGVHRRVESRWLLQVASPRIPKLLRFDLNEIPADDAANVDDQFN